MTRPAFIKHFSEAPLDKYALTQEVMGESRLIGEATGTERLGVDVTTVLPGKRSSYFHHHTLKEEFFYVLDGRCRVRVGNEVYDLIAGDAVSRPPGTGVPHQFFNPYPQPCRVLMLAAMTGKGVADEVFWPEIEKAMKVTPAGRKTRRRLKSKYPPRA